MANDIFSAIDAALAPTNPWRPLKPLISDLGFKVDADVLKEDRRLAKIESDALQRMAELGNGPSAAIHGEQAKARAGVEKGPPFTVVRSKADILEAQRAEVRMIKNALHGIYEDHRKLCEPVVEEFKALAESHIATMEELERAEYERFGVPFLASPLVNALRRAVASLDPGHLLTWLK